jgi:hypothetical protein
VEQSCSKLGQHLAGCHDVASDSLPDNILRNAMFSRVAGVVRMHQHIGVEKSGAGIQIFPAPGASSYPELESSEAALQGFALPPLPARRRVFSRQTVQVLAN